MSEQLMMHGPVELSISIWVINDDTEQAGEITRVLSTFTYPTRESISAYIQKFAETELINELAGFRLMNKHEAWAAIMMHKKGIPSKLVTYEEWDPI